LQPKGGASLSAWPRFSFQGFYSREVEMVSKEISERIKKRIEESGGEYSKEAETLHLMIRNRLWDKNDFEFYRKYIHGSLTWRGCPTIQA